MTVIFIKDVIERYDEKVSFTKAIAANLIPTLQTDISEQIIIRYNNKTIALGGCDSLGRCNKDLLFESCKNHDVVIMPCIGGRNEYEAKRELNKTNCNIIDLEPPRIRHIDAESEYSISDMVASAVAKYVKQIIK